MKKTISNLLVYILFPSLVPLLLNKKPYTKEYMIILFITYILLAIYFIIIYKNDLKKDLKKINKKDILKSLIYFLIGFSLMILANYIINYKIIPNGISNNELENRKVLLNNKIIYSIMLCTLTPFIEEIIFRLSLKKAIKNSTIFIIISSIIFSTLHLLSNTKLIELLYFIPYFILGLTFSITYIKTNNVFNSILLHIINNTLTVIIVLLFKGVIWKKIIKTKLIKKIPF